MFYARIEVLKTVLDLGLTRDQFEPEDGQVDGTLAHAVERAFSLGLIKTGTFLADTGFPENDPFLTVNRNHYFTV
jgi:lipopolysaccharide biosynthesis protein